MVGDLGTGEQDLDLTVVDPFSIVVCDHSEPLNGRLHLVDEALLELLSGTGGLISVMVVMGGTCTCVDTYVQCTCTCLQHVRCNMYMYIYL